MTGEITYGLERLAMYLQGVESMFDLVWTEGPQGRVTYGDVFHQNEVEQSKYNFDYADVAVLLRHFDEHEQSCNDLLAAKLPLPAYEQVLKASHTFNLLDARRAISVTERARFILRVRTLARGVAQAYYASREALGFPMLRGAGASARSPRASRARWRWTRRGHDCARCAGGARAHRAARPADRAGHRGVAAQGAAHARARICRRPAHAPDQAGLTVVRLESFATPRRLAVHFRRLAIRAPDQLIKRRGPPLSASFDAAGAPTRAATAFAHSCGVALEALGRERDVKGGEYLYFEGLKSGAATMTLLPGLLQQSLDALPIPQRMRWGSGRGAVRASGALAADAVRPRSGAGNGARR